jgi:hypothetical protein
MQRAWCRYRFINVANEKRRKKNSRKGAKMQRRSPANGANKREYESMQFVLGLSQGISFATISVIRGQCLSFSSRLCAFA